MEAGKREEIVVCACGCGQKFLRYDDHNRPRRFISGHNQKGNFKQRISLICDYCGIPYEKLQCQLNYDHHFCSNHCRACWCGQKNANDLNWRIRQGDINKRNGNKPPSNQKGKDHWNWKGGISLVNKTERQSTEYVKWRKSVLAKDNYTCQICGIRGGELSAHHKKEWAKHPELRYDVNNGECLHYDCHMELHGLKKKIA
jgi:hypothetical protein